MTLKLNKKSVVVFDLDDTLYKEIDFLLSAYKEIACYIDKEHEQEVFMLMINWYKEKKNVFSALIDHYSHLRDTPQTLLEKYRMHLPGKMEMLPGAQKLMSNLVQYEISLGLITDGRSITQRNKLKALGIEALFDTIIISEEIGSEKPNKTNFKLFEDKFIDGNFTYIADNTTKDFIVPEQLSWQIVCLLDDGRNIHKQNVNSLPAKCILIKTFDELILNYES